MAKFVLKIGRDETVRESDVVSIGSRSSCSFSLDDPLLAEEHCKFDCEGGAYYIEGMGTSIGTYLNGVGVAGRRPVADGDLIVVGVTRLTIKITTDEDPTFTMTVKSVPWYDDKKDALEWSKKEVGFGRFRPVSLGNWAVAFSMLILVPLTFFVPATSDDLLEPGHTFHSSLDLYHERLAGLDESDQDCSACHDAFFGTPNDKCLACHEEEVRRPKQHPAYGDDQEWEMDCAACHVDHRGTKEMALIHRQAQDSCEQCHPKAWVTKNTTRTLDLPSVDIKLDYLTFSHRLHFEKTFDGHKLDCNDCHAAYDDGVPASARALEGDRPREFAPVDYQACLKCHEAGAPQAALRLEPSWHGAQADQGQHCLVCHGEVNDEAMKTVEAFTVKRHFGFKTRSHEAESLLAAHTTGNPDACIECHRQGDELKGGKGSRVAVFEHGTHVHNAWPADGDKARLSGKIDDIAIGSCVYCHDDLAKTSTLGHAGPQPYPEESCKECHPNALEQTFDPPNRAATGVRTEFPHDTHLAVEGGCFACHDFPQGTGVAGLPTTADDVKDCTKCHTGHASVGVVPDSGFADGTCQKCHQKDDPVYGTEPFVWKRPVDKTFRHESRGHAGWTAEGRCVDCHGDAIWQTDRLSDVVMPREDEGACRECHVTQMERFHWR